MKRIIVIMLLIYWPCVSTAANLFVVPTYDGSIVWEASIDHLLAQIYEDLRRLIKPTDGKITSAFGMRDHPILGIKRHHNGIDFACSVGTPIKAVLDGIVKRAGKGGGYGRLVEVEHEDVGLTSRYAHLSRILVKTGRKVNRGDIIGLSGKSGLATGPHLHFELYRKGKPIDPALMLGKRAGTPSS
jgi:murein DD-endopeptidase MepM/ murein hydrolase activator NlpD